MNSDPHDPFAERIAPASRATADVLGAKFVFESTDDALTRLALEAFGGLPASRPAGDNLAMSISMRLNHQRTLWDSRELPPPPALSSGGGFLCATIDAGNFVVVDPAHARALVCASRAMLQYPRLARYELIEFAVLTLAARRQALVPLHAACIGSGDVACLILGASGAGKSSMCLLGLQNGMFVLAEDSAFVRPATMEIFGAPNYLHVRADARDMFSRGALRERINRSPIIERRSGMKKFEVDLREAGNTVSQMPLRLAAIVRLMERSAGTGSALQACDTKTMLTYLQDDQPYAAGLPEWSVFCESMTGVPCYLLRRTDPPEAAIDQLRSLCSRHA